MVQNIAFKCTYNNGGEGNYVSFSGTYAQDIIKRNIKQGRVWHNQTENLCEKYHNRSYKGNLSVYPCYKSKLFTKWKFNARWFRN